MEKAINFWNLIKSIDKIVIPTIQRDYAQGRFDNKILRENFLNALQEAISFNRTLTMDFVYGVIQDKRFIPLDGQQRLTTLWLLHWYVAYKADILNNVRDELCKFSYETRSSSTQFCMDICTLKTKPSNVALRDWIVSQTWFYHHYQQNPTVQAMLNMICGTDSIDADTGIEDGIDKVFSDLNYKSIWERLTTTDCISFYNLKIDMDDSDELYVKMNARGRQLTDFENFKAELVEHVTKTLDDQYATEFASKMDVDWTDIFWPKRFKNTPSIDDAYFAFLRRFFYNECVMKYDRKVVEEKIKQVTSEYNSFNIYQEILDEETIKRLVTIMDNIRGNGINANDINASCSWEEFEFIPKYIEEDSVSSITELQRLVFYAVCKYLEYGSYDETSFNEWKRFVWNICTNKSSDVKGVMELFDQLAVNSHDILTCLCTSNRVWKNNKEQMIEEQQKARHLNEFPEIKDAEQYAFFKGAIRFLFTDSEGNENWNDFIQKFNIAQSYFDKQGVKPLYKEEAKLLRRYIVLLGWDWDNMIFDNSKDSWHDRLLNDKFILQNDKILRNDDVLSFDYENFISDHSDIRIKYAKEFLVHNDIFTNAVSKCIANKYSKFLYGSVVLHPYNAKAEWKYYVINPRTEWLYSDKLDIKFIDENLEKLRHVKLLFGKDIWFIYKGYNFEWHAIHNEGKGDIYLRDSDWNNFTIRRGNENMTDSEKYYCFDIDTFHSTIEDFQTKLDLLISQYKIDYAVM